MTKQNCICFYVVGSRHRSLIIGAQRYVWCNASLDNVGTKKELTKYWNLIEVNNISKGPASLISLFVSGSTDTFMRVKGNLHLPTINRIWLEQKWIYITFMTSLKKPDTKSKFCPYLNFFCFLFLVSFN